MKYTYILLIGFFLTTGLFGQEIDNPQVSPEYMVKKINDIRRKGCKCGRKRMKPVQPIKWNGTLYKAAKNYSAYMEKYDHFSHISLSGKNVGDRFDRVGYPFRFSGENIGYGYDDFDSVLIGWLESTSHCKMIMNKDMVDMAIGRYGIYWVQYFGAPQPPGTRRVGTRYTEN